MIRYQLKQGTVFNWFDVAELSDGGEIEFEVD
jgi:hypothetical protein